MFTTSVFSYSYIYGTHFYLFVEVVPTLAAVNVAISANVVFSCLDFSFVKFVLRKYLTAIVVTRILHKAISAIAPGCKESRKAHSTHINSNKAHHTSNSLTHKPPNTSQNSTSPSHHAHVLTFTHSNHHPYLPYMESLAALQM